MVPPANACEYLSIFCMGGQTAQKSQSPGQARGRLSPDQLGHLPPILFINSGRNYLTTHTSATVRLSEKT